MDRRPASMSMDKGQNSEVALSVAATVNPAARSFCGARPFFAESGCLLTARVAGPFSKIVICWFTD